MKRFSLVILTLIFFFGMLIYPVLRLWYWLFPDLPIGTIALLIIMVVPLLPRLLQRCIPDNTVRLLNAISSTWLGIYFILFPIIVCVELLRLAMPLSDRIWGSVALSLWFAISTYSLINAQCIVIRDIVLNGENGATGHSLVHISDIHIGSRKAKYLKRVVQRIQKLGSHPTAVLITGDLVDAPFVSQADLSALSEITVPSFFTTGNHERYENCEEIVRWLRNLGITVLRNASVSIASFQIVGLDDSDNPNVVREGLAEISPEENRYRVLLLHRPTDVTAAANWGAHLMLSGHTHNGQIFPFDFFVRRFFPRIHGSYDINGMHLQISAGTGTWGPLLRLGSHNEITRLVFE